MNCVNRGTDLSTIYNKAKAGHYGTVKMYHADLHRMFQNCRVYNKPTTQFVMCADKLDAYATTKLRDLFG